MAALSIGALTAILAAMTLLPALPVAHGLVRVCDFPRVQIACIALALIAVTIAFLPMSAGVLLLLAVQASTVAAQTAICLRFTPLWRVQSLPFGGASDDPSVVSIVAANVKMSNQEYSRVADLVRKRDPHIAIFMETNACWLAALAPLKERMPFSIEQPQANSYGMLLLSRLPLVEFEVRFLLIPEVPSIKAAVALPDGRRLRLHVLHPEPPVPYEDTLGRDGELILTAREAKADPLPTIVAGDLNDVAWSRTTRRFQRLSGLLDPRIGRGFFNTFDARFPFLRWPLDHLFHSAQFRLVGLERLPDIGSDHFPMFFQLALAEREAAGERPESPDPDDIEEADEVAGDASRLDRKAIGSDWEK